MDRCRKLESTLVSIKEESEVIYNRTLIKLERFINKYPFARVCFKEDRETDDLFLLFFDLANEYDLPGEDIYFIWEEAKYDYYGSIRKDFISIFATILSMKEIDLK